MTWNTHKPSRTAESRRLLHPRRLSCSVVARWPGVRSGAAWVCNCRGKPRGSLAFADIESAVRAFARHLATHGYRRSVLPPFPPARSAAKRAAVTTRDRSFPLPTDPLLAPLLPLLAEEYEAALTREMDDDRRARAAAEKTKRAERAAAARPRRDLRARTPRWNSTWSGRRCECLQCDCDRKAQRDGGICLACAGNAHGRMRRPPPCAREPVRPPAPKEEFSPLFKRIRVSSVARGRRKERPDPVPVAWEACSCNVGACARGAIARGMLCSACALGDHSHPLA